MKRLLLSVHDVTPHHFERLKTIHPNDLDSPRLIEKIKRTVCRQQQRRRLCQYAELAG